MANIYEKTESIYSTILKIINKNRKENWRSIKENLMIEVESEEEKDNSLNSQD